MEMYLESAVISADTSGDSEGQKLGGCPSLGWPLTDAKNGLRNKGKPREKKAWTKPRALRFQVLCSFVFITTV